MKIAALVPVRSGSKRIPHKNLAKLGDESLVARKVRQLKNCETVTHVYVGTDSLELAQEAEQAGAEVVMRDPVCCDEEQASANMMIADFVRRIDADIVLWAHATNPFVESETYDTAVRKFIEKEEKGFDSLMSVLAMQEHFWTPNYHPLNYNPYKERHTLAKELPAYYRQTGAFFIQRHRDMKNNSYFFGRHPYLFKTTELEAVDINTPFDLNMARILCSQLNQL